MTKLTLADLANLENEITFVSLLNTNSAGIESAFEDTVSRSGKAPNQMLSDLDMNSHTILNLPAASNPTSPVRKLEYEFDTALLSTLENQVASLISGTPGALFTTDRIVTTGANPYAAGPDDLLNADIVIGSPGTRHDSSIMMWSNVSANRLSSENERFNFDSYHSIGGEGAYITGAISGDSFFSGPVLIKDGRPWADVRAFGEGLGTNDDWSGAFQAAIDYISTRYGGGIVYAPPNTGGSPYVCLSDITLPAYVTLQGTGRFTTIGNGHNEFTVILNGPQAALDNLHVYGKGSNNDTGSFGATKSAVKVTELGVEARLTNVTAVGGFHSFELRAPDIFMCNCNGGGGYGSAMVYIAAGMWLIRNKFDQSWPKPLTANITSGGGVPAYQSAHAYNVGDLVSISGQLIQCWTAGTTHATTPPALRNSGVLMPDGTAEWLHVSAATYYGIQIDGPLGSPITEVQITQTDLSGSFMAGIALTNTQPGGSPPTEIKVTQGVIGQHLQAGVWILSGGRIQLSDMEIGGGAFNTGSAVVVGIGTQGDNSICNSELFGTRNTIEIQGGTNNIINGNRIYGASNAGVLAFSGVSKFIITNNCLGVGSGFTPNTIGVQVGAGSSDKYIIANNIFTGAVSDLSDGGTGVNKTVSGNVF